MSYKNFIVSGAAGNLGQAVVQAFLKEGHQVIGLVRDKKDRDPVQGYQEIEVDLTQEDEVKHITSSLLEKYTQIDGAILTAGGFKAGTLAHTEVSDLEAQYRLNFITAFTLVRALLPHFKEKKQGKFFFIGSDPGMDTKKGKGAVAYSMAKSQLFQLANIINADSKGSSIKAYMVVPSTIDTPQNRKAVPDANFSNWEKPASIAKIILHYSGNPREQKTTLIVQEEQ